jgi:2-oxoglutarate ferredoxin oxidoreductase subunit alpha
MPTKEAQGDLNMAVYGSHGEVPRVVLAPQSVADCFEKAVRAVNIACKFHVPVILLSSQSLSHRNQTIDAPDFENMYIYDEPFMTPEMFKGKTFKRYARMPDGLPSIRSIPGTPGGTYRATGLEHDETGNPAFEPETRRMMVDRRRDRMLAVEREFQATMAHDTYFKGHCPIGVMSWGTTASTVREVLGEFTKEGKDFSYLCPRILWPLPDRSINMFLSSGIRLIFVFELNSTRQFAELIRARYTAELIKHGIEVISITKDEGLPFSPGEIRSAITSALAERRISEEIFA